MTARPALAGAPEPSLLRGVTAHRVLSVPRTTERGQRPDPNAHRPQLFATLTAAHAMLGEYDGVFLTAWLRPDGGPIRIIVGGRPDPLPVSPPTADGLRRAAYPPGAVVEDEPAVGELLDRFRCWVACEGRSDALWAQSAGQAGHGALARGSFDDVVAHLPTPFAWLVIAQPLATTAVEAEMRALRTSLPDRRARAMSESDRLEVERSEGRFRELHRATGSGVWLTSVLVGAADPVTARATAAVLCACAELADQPYVLAPVAPTDGWADGLGGGSAFAATTEFLSVLARPPARELPGLRTETPHSFDVSVEPGARGEFALGDVLDVAHRPVESFAVSRPTLNRHAFVCGATGSGKSQTVRTLLENLTRVASPVPWLVIEPAKAEYSRMAGRLAGMSEVTVIRPGDPDTVPASLNPLEPEPGFPLQSHADLVRALFLAAFEANEPFPQVLSRALTQVYTDAGWDLVTGEPRPAMKPVLYAHETAAPVIGRYPTLGQLQRTASAIVGQIGYGKEITADVRGFVDVRIGSLREGTPGRFFEGGHPLDVEELLSRNVVLELEDITNDQDKAFLIGAVLIRIVEHLRVRAARGDTRPGLRHLTVVEEAHRLLKNVRDGPAAAAVELFASLLAEIRAYGEGVVVVEQIPTKILPDVVKNSALKIMHRLPALDDREVVGATINLTPEQSELVVSFEPGMAAVAVDGMDAPLLVRVPDREDSESERGAIRVPPLRAARSPLCPVDCAATPCVLREINNNEHRSRQKSLLVWTETATVSFLIGEPPPLPSPAVQQLLVPLTSHARRCTLVHAVERSTEVRRIELTSWFDVDDFAAHVLRALERLLDGDRADDGDWRRWTAGLYRWLEMRHALRRSIAEGHADAAPHPNTAQWADLGMVLDAPTRAGQYAQLRAHPTYGEDRQRFLLGDARLSGLLDAVLELSGTVTDAGITRALDHGCRGQRTDLIVPRIAGPLRAAGAGAH